MGSSTKMILLADFKGKLPVAAPVVPLVRTCLYPRRYHGNAKATASKIVKDVFKKGDACVPAL